MPEKTDFVWMDGRLRKWEEATVHVLSQGIHYGAGVFEGIRCYSTGKGPAIFRLDEHLKRLFDSAKIFGTEIPFSREELRIAILETVKANKLDECYIRPIAFGGNGGFDLTTKRVPVHVSVAVWPWNNYLGKEGMRNGIRAIVSSFTRLHANASMTKAKVTGNYANSILAKQEALNAGCDESVMLDHKGLVSEGSSENIFAVRDGLIFTPPGETILEGITRDSIMKLATDFGLKVREEPITRDQLYIADEVFLTGTAAEVVAVREIDSRVIGSGRMGPITEKLQKAFSEVVRGLNPKYEGWLTLVD